MMYVMYSMHPYTMLSQAGPSLQAATGAPGPLLDNVILYYAVLYYVILQFITYYSIV